MRFRSLTIALLVFAAASLWLMRVHGDAAAESQPASAPVETVAPALARTATGAASRAAPADPRRHEVPEMQESRPTGKVLLTGRVVDPAGRAVQNAMVCLDRGRPDFGGLEETGAAGTYEYPVEPGVHDLVARGDGTALARARVQVPEGVDRFEAPPLVLSGGKVIRGRVLDSEQKPMVDIRVKAYAEREESTIVLSAGKLIFLGCEDVLTRDDGTFEMQGVEDLPYTVRVQPEDSHPHLRSEPREVKGVVPDGRPLEFRLVPEAFVRGVVLDAVTGLPIPRFFVNWTEVRSADGRFEVPIGKYSLFQVEAHGYLPGPSEHGADVIGKDEDRVVRLSPDPDTATLVVVAKDEAGAPVHSFRVSWTNTHTLSRSREEARESDGSLRIIVPSGATDFLVEAEARASSGFVAGIARGEEQRVEVRLARSAPIRLRVVLPDGNTARNVDALIEDEQGARPLWRFAFTKPQGRNPPIRFIYGADAPLTLYEADGLIGWLPPGRYRLILGKAGASVTPFTVSPGRTEELTVKLNE